MFYRHKWLTRQGKLFEPWIAASYKGNFPSSCAENLRRIDIRIICGNIEEVIKSKSQNLKHRISLRLSTTLIHGTCHIFNKQIEELYDNCCKLFLLTSTKRPYNEILAMISSDDSYSSNGYNGVDNEENSSFSDQVRNTEPAARSFSCLRDNTFDDFSYVDHRPRRRKPDTFIGIKALRKSVRMSTRISGTINIGGKHNSNVSGDRNCPENNTAPPKKKKRQKRRTYRRPMRRTATHKTKKNKVSAIEKEVEECQELPSPERLRGDSDSDSLMSFGFEWDELNHSFKSVRGGDITELVDKHYMSEPQESKTPSTPLPLSPDIVSDTSESQDSNVEDFFSEKTNRRHRNRHIQSFHVLYPKGMDIKSLKIFADPISNYGELDQSDVDYSSTTNSSPARSLTTRDDSLREEFNENGVLSKLLKLWPRNEIVTIRDIINLGSQVVHSRMAAGKIFNSLINLNNRHYVSIIKNEGNIENIMKGRNLVRTCRYHPYYSK